MQLAERRTITLLFALMIAVSMSGATTGLISRTLAKETSPDATRVYKTGTGKTIIISETHPVGRSLSTIAVSTEGFDHNLTEKYEDRDPISDVFVADIDGNGFDEIYIITASAGSGSHGSVMGFASNRDKSLSMIHFPEIEAGDVNFKGYMGHDTFTDRGSKTRQDFPDIQPGRHQSSADRRDTKARLWFISGRRHVAVEGREIGEAE